MRRIEFFFILITGSLVCSTCGSVVEHTNLHPSGQVGLTECYSANTLGFTKLLFAVSGNFAYDDHLVPSMEKPVGLFEFDTIQSFAVLYGIYPALAFGVTDFLDLSIVQPFFFDVLAGELPTGGAGDLSVALKCRVPGSKLRSVEGALLTDFTFPNGNKEHGYLARHGYYFHKRSDDGRFPGIDSVSFFTAGKPTWSLTALGTVGKHRLFLHVNLGACITFDKRLDNAITGGLGLEFNPSKMIGLFADIYAEPRFQNLIHGFKINEDPFHFSPGMTFCAPGGALLSIGGSFKLSSNREVVYQDRTGTKTLTARIEPRWRLFVQLGWNGFLIARDKDDDLLRDRDDVCPEIKEDVDGYEDNDGCPDVDNDQDKITDDHDSCPDAPEDMDGFRDTDGCSDFDNDNDGIPDSLDKCPDNPEDRDGFADDDGCPDPDNDKDGIPDSLDKCPGVPEDADGFEDDGCPDLDNDLDGVPDSSDMCPESAGVAEEKGCSKSKEKVKEIKHGRLILAGVQFDGGSADLTPGSSEDLDRVYQSLVDWPDIHLEIQAHTDNSAPPEACLKLSQKRADVVREYLIKKGIPASRLNAEGKGSVEPIADNKSVQGRRLNNRIEIHRND